MSRNLLNLDEYEELTAEEAWERFGWGSETKEGGTVLHYADESIELFANEMRTEYDVRDEPQYGCEVYECGDMTGQWFAPSWEGAIRGAVIDSVGHDVMREECCCEDAVNCTAREAYVKLFGECPIMSMDVREVDKLLGMAMEFVRANVRWVNYEWEEYWA